MGISTGIIGCGNIAWLWDRKGGNTCNTHAKAYSQNPLVRLKACADPVFERAKGLAKRYPGVKPYDNYQTMLQSEDFDVVSVCVTPETHHEVLEYILTETDIRYILSEKPLTTSTKQTEAIYQLAKQKGAHIQINYLRRWDDALNKVKRLIERRVLGEFLFGSVLYYGGVKNNAIHFFDFLSFLGLTVKFEKFISETKAYNDDLFGSFLMTVGTKGSFVFRWFEKKQYWLLEVDLFFETGRIRINDASEVEVFTVQQDSRYQDNYTLALSEVIPSTAESMMKNSIARIVHSCVNREVSFDQLKLEVDKMKLIDSMEAVLYG